MAQEKAKENNERLEVGRDRELEQYVFSAIKHFVQELHPELALNTGRTIESLNEEKSQ